MLTILSITISLLLLPSFSLHSLILSFILISLLSTLLIYSAPYTFFLSSLTMLDPISSTLVSLTLWVSALIILASNTVFASSNNTSYFSSLIIILAFLLLVAFSASHLLLFYIFFEASLIPTLLLIVGWGYQPERLQAGIYLILYTVAASLPLLLSLLFIASLNGHLSLLLPIAAPLFSPAGLQIWWLATIIAFLVNIPIFLTHLWLPNAHVEAPVAGSIILAGILLNLGGYGILRLSSIFPDINLLLLPPVISISLWGAVITSLICLRQPDLNSLIAYSSVGHMGLLTAGLITSTLWGHQGALAIIIAHGLCSSALFAIANNTYEATSTRSLFITNGLLNIFPLIAMWWFILSATNIAAPPSINLLSEIILITSILSNTTFTILSLAPVSFLAAAYSLHLYTATHHGSPSNTLNPITASSQAATLALLHFVPLLLIIINPEIITNWI